MTRPAFVTIDLAALKHNLARVRHYAGNRSVMAMLKANAYGHDSVQAAQALSTAEAFGVASLDEGLLLREAGMTQPIVLLCGWFEEKELALAAQFNFTLVVHHANMLDQLEKARVSQPLSVWLKINTGMNRLGFDASMTAAVYQRLCEMPIVKKPIGLMTHFARADELNHPMVNEQMQCFERATAATPGLRSLSNSAALLAQYPIQEEWVRPGLMLYGISPFAETTGVDFDLKPAMTLWSRIVAITPIKKGAHVGYGSTWTAPEDMLMGMVGMGYGDGYAHAATNGTPVLVKGKKTQLIGRVCMDMLAIDLRPIPHAKIGDPVTLWGEGLPIEAVACHNDLFVYEMITGIRTRVKREFTACHPEHSTSILSPASRERGRG